MENRGYNLQKLMKELDQRFIGMDDAKRFAENVVGQVMCEPTSDPIPNLVILVGEGGMGKGSFAKVFAQHMAEAGYLKDATLHGEEQWNLNQCYKIVFPAILCEAALQAAELGRILWLDLNLPVFGSMEILPEIPQISQNTKVWISISPDEMKEWSSMNPSILSHARIIQFSPMTAEQGMEFFDRCMEKDGFSATENARSLAKESIAWYCKYARRRKQPFFGSVEELFKYAKMCHAMRCDGQDQEKTDFTLTEEDIPKISLGEKKPILACSTDLESLHEELLETGAISQPGAYCIEFQYLEDKTAAEIAEIFRPLARRMVCIDNVPMLDSLVCEMDDMGHFLEFLSDPEYVKEAIIVLVCRYSAFWWIYFKEPSFCSGAVLNRHRIDSYIQMMKIENAVSVDDSTHNAIGSIGDGVYVNEDGIIGLEQRTEGQQEHLIQVDSMVFA